MTVFLCTQADGARIPEFASINAYATKAEALAAAQGQYSPEDGIRVVDLELGDFGDCWLKVLDRPDPETLEMWAQNLGMVADDLQVSPPGTHPGGAYYWVTPWPEVWVPVIEIDDD